MMKIYLFFRRGRYFGVPLPAQVRNPITKSTNVLIRNNSNKLINNSLVVSTETRASNAKNNIFIYIS